MTFAATWVKDLGLSTACFVSLTLGAMMMPCSFLYAAESDPFSMDTSNWISFDHYKENTRYGRSLPTTPAPLDTKSDDLKADATSDADGPKISVPAAAPNTAKVAVAAPTRALNLPVMPGMNKGYNIQVRSTEDDQIVPAAEITNIDKEPSVAFKENNWQKASTVARQPAEKTSIDPGSDEDKPLDIRMSFLPNPKIVPETLTPQKPPRVKHLAPKPVETVEAPKKSHEELAACAAIDAYKKKQLEAIQGDRQTLAALQAAIAQLGLQKQLSFMTDAQGSLNTTAQNMPEKLDSSSAPKIAQP